MGNSARDQYLRGMGISQWFPRKPLPGAKPSPLLDVPAAEPPTIEDDQPVNKPVPEPMASQQQPEKPDARVLDKQTPVLSPVKKTGVGLTAPPNFRLEALLFAGQCLVINDITSENEPVKPAGMTRLLNNILLALEMPALQEPVARNFNWPILRNPHIDQSSKVAKDATQAFIKKQLSGQDVRVIILMGENAQNFVIPDANTTANPGLFSEYQVIVTRSLSEMIEKPLSKRDAWADLQSLQPG